MNTLPSDRVQGIDLEGAIFRIVTDAVTGGLAVEIRYPEDRSAQFIAFHPAQGEVTASEPQAWWLGLEALHDGCLLLHHFEDPSLPVHRGLEMWTVPDFHVQWKAPDVRLLGATEAGLWVATDTGALVQCLDRKLGTVKAGPLRLEEVAEEMELWKNDLAPVTVPEMASVDDLPPAGGLPGSAPASPVASRLVLGPQQLWAWHTGSADAGLDLHLAIFQDGQFHDHWLLDSGLNSLIAEPFFCFQNRLFWMQGRQSLCWTEL